MLHCSGTTQASSHCAERPRPPVDSGGGGGAHRLTAPSGFEPWWADPHPIATDRGSVFLTTLRRYEHGVHRPRREMVRAACAPRAQLSPGAQPRSHADPLPRAGTRGHPRTRLRSLCAGRYSAWRATRWGALCCETVETVEGLLRMLFRAPSEARRGAAACVPAEFSSPLAAGSPPPRATAPAPSATRTDGAAGLDERAPSMAEKNFVCTTAM